MRERGERERRERGEREKERNFRNLKRKLHLALNT